MKNKFHLAFFRRISESNLSRSFFAFFFSAVFLKCILSLYSSISPDSYTFLLNIFSAVETSPFFTSTTITCFVLLWFLLGVISLTSPLRGPS